MTPRPIAEPGTHGTRGARGRNLVALAVALGLGLVALVRLGHWCRALWADTLAPGPASPSELLMTLTASAAAVVGLWLWLGMLAAAAATLPGALGRGAARALAPVTPRVARALVGMVLGLGIAGGTAGTAVAQEAPVVSASAGWGPTSASPATPASEVAETAGAQTSSSPSAPHSSAVPMSTPSPTSTPPLASTPSLPTGTNPGGVASTGASEGSEGSVTGAASRQLAPEAGWRATRPAVRPSPSPDTRAALGATSAGQATAVDQEVVVRAGDSLWSIAARHLGADASDAEIAAAWPRWYASNTDVIGADPSLILPGQALRVPTAGGAS